MRMFPVRLRGEYIVAIKANKRKSKTFYYRLVSFRVEFVLDKEKAHTCHTIETAEFLANEYLRKRIREVGFVLREF